jgi:hypothetical protein
MDLRRASKDRTEVTLTVFNLEGRSADKRLRSFDSCALFRIAIMDTLWTHAGRKSLIRGLKPPRERA